MGINALSGGVRMVQREPLKTAQQKIDFFLDGSGNLTV
jgi:hypothetical protein